MPTFDTPRPDLRHDRPRPRRRPDHRRRPRRHRRRGAPQRPVQRRRTPGPPSRPASSTRTSGCWSRRRSCAPWLPTSDGGSIDVTIELPAGSHVQRHAGVGGLPAPTAGSATAGSRSASAASRSSRPTRCTSRAAPATSPWTARPAHAELTAGSGEVRVRELDGSAVIKNSNGDTWVGVAGGDLRAQRRQRQHRRRRRHTRASSPRPPTATSGWARSCAARSRSRRRSGDLEVGIREGTAAWLDVSARAGKVHNALDAADGPEPSAEKVEVRARTSRRRRRHPGGR